MNYLLSRYLGFYPARILTGQFVFKYLNYLRSVENLTPSELNAWQWRKLRSILQFSNQSIPYYNRLFHNCSINPDNLITPDIWNNIPILTKSIVQSNHDAFVNPNIHYTFKRSTSGSTGNPLVFYKDASSLAWMDAVMYYSYSWHGIKIGQPQARFWGVPHNRKTLFNARLKDNLMNRIRISAFDLHPNTFERCTQRIRRFNPHYFYGYPSLIYEYAIYYDKLSNRPAFPNLKYIIGTGEQIIPSQLKQIESILGCKFLNEYGCTEAGIIGFDCQYGQMHLMANNIFLEIIKDGKPVLDQEGEIYITELNTRTFPFIRYKLNDIGILSTSKCECGRNLPVIRISKGRIDSYIRTPDGALIYDAVLAYTLKKGIISFKAIQRTVNHIDIFIKVDSNFSNELKNKYAAELQSLIHPNMELIFHKVDELPRDKSGKLRYFVPLEDSNDQIIYGSRAE